MRVTLHSYISDRYDDPDSTSGDEFRIYLAGYMGAVDRLPKIAQAVLACGISCDLVLDISGPERDRVKINGPARILSDRFGTWRGAMKFQREHDVTLYLMSRTPFDEDKLVELALRAPTNSFK